MFWSLRACCAGARPAGGGALRLPCHAAGAGGAHAGGAVDEYI